MNNIAESERLWLQPLSVEHHLEAYHALNSDPEAKKWSSRPPLESLEESKALLLSRLPSEEKPFLETMAIVLRPSESHPEAQIVGFLGVVRVSSKMNAAEVGYGLNTKFWGHGYASEALKLFVDYYWKTDRKDPRDLIMGEVDPMNIASQRVLEKAGFEKRELNEKAYQYENTKTGEKIWKPAVMFILARPK